MENLFQQNTFEQGLNEDAAYSKQPNNSLRQSENMDLFEDGTNFDAVNIQGNAFVSNLIDSVDMDTSNCTVLGAFRVKVSTSGGDKEAVLVFSKTTDNISRIQVYNLVDNVLTTLLDTDDNDTSIERLNFPTDALIDGIYYKNNDQNRFYFVDNNNVVRDIVISETYVNTVHSITVKAYAPLDTLNYTAVEDGGQLLSGSYQFSYRYYNTQTKKYSAIVPFSQPIDIKPVHIYESTTPFVDVIGGNVGEFTNKQIHLSMTVTNANYDAIQLLTLKNNDGSKEVQTVVYVTEPNLEWYNTGEIYYTGTAAETTTTLAEVLIELNDTLITGKTTTEKLQRAMIGNVEYFDFVFDNGPVAITNAHIVETALDKNEDYRNTENAYYFTGYWRDELYRFGVTYMNEYGNWSPVQPLDFSAFYKFAQDTSRGSLTIVTATYDATTQTTQMVVNGDHTTEVFKYDWIYTGGTSYHVFRVTLVAGNTHIWVNGNAPVGTYNFNLGDAYNWNNGADWQFPPRSCCQFSMFTNDDDISSLGLVIRGIVNHPSWAKAMQVVRMERKKDILFQTPHVPTIVATAAASHAMGNGMASADPYSNGTYLEWFKAYQREYATLMPKTHYLGCARNIFSYAYKDAGKDDNYFNSNYYYTINYGTTAIGAEVRDDWGVPDYIVAYPPEFEMNYNGVPFEDAIYKGGMYVEIVDAIQMNRNLVEGLSVGYPTTTFDTSPDGTDPNYTDTDWNFSYSADVFSALNKARYYYTRLGYQYRGGSVAAVLYFRSIQSFITSSGSFDVITFQNSGTTNVNLSPQIKTLLPITVDSPRVTILSNPMIPTGTTTLEANEILYYGGANELTGQVSSESNWEEYTLFGDALVNNPINSPVQNQRALVFQLSDRMEDFTYIMAYRAKNDGDDFFPLSTLGYYANASTEYNLYDDRQFQKDIYLHHNDGVTTTCYSKTVSSDGDIDSNVAAAAFVLNVKSGLGSDRYGAATNQDPFFSLGKLHYLSEAEVTNNTPIDFDDIYGGDCFITRYQAKVSNSGLFMDWIGCDKIGDDFSKNVYPFVTSGHLAGVEIIDMYIEASLPSDLQSQVDIYPQETTGLTPYNRTWTYDYNFGYAIQNKAIPYFADQRSITTTRTRFEERYVWSDQRVAETDEYGWDIFRPTNFKDLPDTYGGITRLIKTDNDVVWSIQQNAVKPLLIGEAQLDTQDGLFISMKGYQEFQDNSLRWESTTIGSQNMGSIVSSGDAIYGTDVLKRKVWKIEQGGGMVYISDVNEKSFFDLWLKDSIEEINLTAGYNFNRNEYLIIQQDMTLLNRGDVYKNKVCIWNDNLMGGKGAWMTKITSSGAAEFADDLVIKAAVYAGFGMYMIGIREVVNQPDPTEYSLALEEMYAGDYRGIFFNQYFDSRFAIVNNERSYLVKTFDVMKINSSDVLNSMQMSIVVSDGAVLQQTGNIDISSGFGLPPYRAYNVNRIRNATPLRQRMRGHNALTYFKIVNEPSETNTNRKVVVSDIVCQMGVSYPK